ncbi:CDP-glycerol glycerophosphotransferase family protein [Sanguibacter sp. A247]|uniref:CDP-glycerol glycerophosphotransferase family protein n=1 Tax=unclassified Sanguibacter TaxID=2645534 RepID=UPI003FD73F99
MTRAALLRVGAVLAANIAVIVNVAAALAALLVVADVEAGMWLMAATIAAVVGFMRPVSGAMRAFGGTGILRPPGRLGLGTFAVSRSLAAVLVALVTDTVAGRVLAGALLAHVLAEPVLGRLAGTWQPVALNAPWVREQRPPRLVHVVAPAAGVVLFVALVLVALGVSLLPVLVLSGVSLAMGLLAGVDGLVRRRAGLRAEAALHAGLRAYAPRFVLYWEAGLETAYQISMWLPYLEQLGERFVVVLRHPRNIATVAELTDHPVVVVRSMDALDQVLVPSLTTAFYVNNSIRNCHFVRFTELTHVQLNHGDSDKAPSFNPVMRMYDLNFVAGQAAVDRYAANGVTTRADYFRIVGRPQVSDVAPASARPAGAPLTVLYAPTWAGFMADSNYSSLLQGPAIIRELVRREVTVVFRPHPHAWRSRLLAAACTEIEQILSEDTAATGRAHLYGATAATEMSVVDCFNAADAMISDVSSVVPDFLFSGKPFALVAVGLTAGEFLVANPVARGAYVVEENLATLTSVLDDLLVADPLRAERLRMREYYLGDVTRPDYVGAFAETAREVIGRERPVL